MKHELLTGSISQPGFFTVGYWYGLGTGEAKKLSNWREKQQQQQQTMKGQFLNSKSSKIVGNQIIKKKKAKQMVKYH